MSLSRMRVGDIRHRLPLLAQRLVDGRDGSSHTAPCCLGACDARRRQPRARPESGRGEACPQRLAPRSAIRRQLVPARLVDLEQVHGLGDGAPVGHGRRTWRPGVSYPRGEHAAR